jgi:protein gp37
MGKTTIEWTDYTFNPWRGCTKVSPGCQHCYAEVLSVRNPKGLGKWGSEGERVVASESYWKQPITWNRKARAEGVRRKVFCASLADVFEDREELAKPRQQLFELIADTKHSLDWLLLTKRPEEALKFSPVVGALPNLWLGVSVEDQQRADERIPLLRNIPAAVRFLSCEPLLGDMVLSLDNIDWVIVGGESGPNARPCRIGWIGSLVRQCKDAGAAVFVKQLGANVEACDAIDAADYFPGKVRLSEAKRPYARVHLQDAKGGDMAEWPTELCVRKFPEV